MKLYPLTCPAVSARTSEWQEWFMTASDLDIAHVWQVAMSEGEERISDAAFCALGGRALHRLLVQEKTIKLSPIHIKHVCAQ